MKKTRIFLSTVILAMFAEGVAFAHPPTNMVLSYNQESRILHAEMTHVTGNILKHYIRRIIVFKNEEQILSRVFPKQTTPHGVIEDFSIEAHPNDVIRVKAFCKEGGQEEETLTIPQPEESKPAKEK